MKSPPPLGPAQRVVRQVRAWSLPAKVMAALTLALLPLGVLALSAATSSYAALGHNEQRLVRARLEAVRQAAVPRIEAMELLLRAAVVLGSDPDCRAGLNGLATTGVGFTQIALFGARGELICGGDGTGAGTTALARAAQQPDPTGRADHVEAVRDPETGDLVVLLRRPIGAAMVGTVAGRILPERARSRLLETRLVGRDETVRLAASGTTIVEAGPPALGPSGGQIASETLIDGLTIEIARPRPRLGLMQALAVALPVLMWLTALGICWVAIDGLVAGPLKRMRVAVDRYGRGDRSIRISPAAGTSQELLDFARAFDGMADRADGHEADMQAALSRQIALTREVHHRVKNNLQIVSSLLSLQARGVENPEVAAAYTLIRQRVTALSLVHRWIYAGSPEAGVDLRGLLADLCANIAHSFERADGGRLNVSCATSKLVVNQDTALPIAFLVSELSANAVQSGATWIRVEVADDGGAGFLCVSSDGLSGADGFDPIEPASARIIAGLARQLRGTLQHDPEGRYSIRFAPSKPAPAAAA